MAKNYYDITLALAGICQSAKLVQQLAHEGQCDNSALLTSLKSLLQTNPSSTLATFGQHERELRLGLETLVTMLDNSKRANSTELTRYVISLMVLERKLHANPAALNELANRLSQLERQLIHFDLESETIQGALAGIYVDIISPLGPRIQVTGSPLVLQRPQIQVKVRAALLSGLRATVLWQQVGGSRLQLMFSRGRLLKQAQQLLASC